MVKIETFLSIGYPGADHEDVLEFEDNVTDKEIEEAVFDWAQNYIDIGWSRIEPPKEDA